MNPMYRSEVNRDVEVARPGEFAPVQYGPIRIWPPVVLAPMAGVTNHPFRSLCKQYGAGLYVSEMLTARGLVEGHKKTEKLAQFGPDENPRSLQLYGTDPAYLGEAARRLVGEGRVDHIDMNFGCPVRKVTSHGGGSAIPLKPKLMARLVRAVVQGAGDVPVTIKFRIGVDDDLVTYRSSGDVGESEGCVAVGLHARTAAQLYDGDARWEAIGDLKARLKIPVLGNGDIWEPWDALRMMRATKCDAVIIGRGCLGKPWLFRDLADVFEGREPQDPPNLGGVVDVALDHARRLVDWFGETSGMFQMRKFSTWYTKAFPSTARLRERLMKVVTYGELETVLRSLDRDVPFPVAGLRAKRGKRSGTQVVSLPPGYLDSLDDEVCPDADAELLAVDGG
jgi:nifR3 family TIM-barrel protein